MQNYIHETVLRDLIEIMHDAKNVDIDSLEKFMGKKRSMKSLSSSAEGMVMVYPVLVSNSLRIENAQLVSKAVERKAVSMLRMVFSAMQFSDTENVMDYLSRFHINLKNDSDLSVDSILDTINKYVLKNPDAQVQEGTNLINRGEFNSILNRDMKYSDCVVPNSVSENSISDYRFTSIHGNTMIVNEAYDDDDLREREFDFKKKVEIEKIKSTNRKDIAAYLQKNLLDNEVKKANELVETQMLIQVIITKNGKTVPVNSIIGIKAKMHPIDSIDIIERIYTKNKDKNFFMKLVQASTREISFFNDFLFAIDRAKIDALSVSNRNRKSSDLWKVLERRAKKSTFKRLIGARNNAMAISTLVISQEEVEYIKKEYNIDVEDIGVIRPIMESYNLMSFIIVDEATEVAKFIFDTGQDLYEHLSFNSLERESTDNSYKRIVNLIAKSS